MPAYFVDTWYLIARFNRYDDAHRDVVSLDRRLPQSSFVTHDGIFMEFLAFVSEFGAAYRISAQQAVRDALRRWIVFPADRGLFMTALDLYRDRSDKGYSLVDCMSMSLMKSQRVQHILSNDHHFSQEGFTLVNA